MIKQLAVAAIVAGALAPANPTAHHTLSAASLTQSQTQTPPPAPAAPPAAPPPPPPGAARGAGARSRADQPELGDGRGSREAAGNRPRRRGADRRVPPEKRRVQED
jgi:hypothetical protein